MLAFIAYAVLLSVTLEPAKASQVCASPDSLAAEANDCTDNIVFSEAAVECLEKLEGAIDAQSKAVSASMKNIGSQAKRSQAAKQTNSKLDYRLSKATLEKLIAMAKNAQRETSGFLDSVMWPEDFDNEEITGPDFEAFLESDSCYKENKDLITNVLKDFDDHIAELEKAKEASQVLEASTQGRETSMDSIVPNSMSAKPTRVVASPDPGSGKKKPKLRKPTITGVEEDAKKRAK